MENIYTNMYNSNTTWLKTHDFIHDTKLNDATDDRRVIALVADGDFEYHEPWKKLNILLEETVDSGSWMQPRLHHTFICISPLFNKDNLSSTIVNDYNINEIKTIIEDKLKGGYRIVFDRIIPVKTGFVLCGTSDTDINQVRDYLREKGYINGERYHLDILHITLLRNVDMLSNQDDKNRLISAMNAFKKEPYVTFNVKSINVTEASWTMQDGTFKILKRINL